MHPRGSKHVEGAKNWTKSLIWIVYIALVYLQYHVYIIIIIIIIIIVVVVIHNLLCFTRKNRFLYRDICESDTISVNSFSGHHLYPSCKFHHNMEN